MSGKGIRVLLNGPVVFLDGFVEQLRARMKPRGTRIIRDIRVTSIAFL